MAKSYTKIIINGKEYVSDEDDLDTGKFHDTAFDNFDKLFEGQTGEVLKHMFINDDLSPEEQAKYEMDLKLARYKARQEYKRRKKALKEELRREKAKKVQKEWEESPLIIKIFYYLILFGIPALLIYGYLH